MMPYCLLLNGDQDGRPLSSVLPVELSTRLLSKGARSPCIPPSSWPPPAAGTGNGRLLTRQKGD